MVFTEVLDKEGSALLKFVQSEGGLDIGLPGTYKDYDKLVEGFTSLDEAGMKEKVTAMNNLVTVHEAMSTVPPDQVGSGKVYLKLMERVLEQGASFLENVVTAFDTMHFFVFRVGGWPSRTYFSTSCFNSLLSVGGKTLAETSGITNQQ